MKVWCFDNNMKVTNCPRTRPIIKFTKDHTAEYSDEGLLIFGWNTDFAPTIRIFGLVNTDFAPTA